MADTAKNTLMLEACSSEGRRVVPRVRKQSWAEPS